MHRAEELILPDLAFAGTSSDIAWLVTSKSHLIHSLID